MANWDALQKALAGMRSSTSNYMDMLARQQAMRQSAMNTGLNVLNTGAGIVGDIKDRKLAREQLDQQKQIADEGNQLERDLKDLEIENQFRELGGSQKDIDKSLYEKDAAEHLGIDNFSDQAYQDAINTVKNSPEKARFMAPNTSNPEEFLKAVDAGMWERAANFLLEKRVDQLPGGSYTGGEGAFERLGKGISNVFKGKSSDEVADQIRKEESGAREYTNRIDEVRDYQGYDAKTLPDLRIDAFSDLKDSLPGENTVSGFGVSSSQYADGTESRKYPSEKLDTELNNDVAGIFGMSDETWNLLKEDLANGGGVIQDRAAMERLVSNEFGRMENWVEGDLSQIPDEKLRQLASGIIGQRLLNEDVRDHLVNQWDSYDNKEALTEASERYLNGIIPAITNSPYQDVEKLQEALKGFGRLKGGADAQGTVETLRSRLNSKEEGEWNEQIDAIMQSDPRKTRQEAAREAFAQLFPDKQSPSDAVSRQRAETFMDRKNQWTVH